MKKITSLILALVLTFSLVALSACGDKTTDDKSTAASDDKVITVGASATPHAEILEQIKQALADEGYELKIVTYDDYVLPNQALADGTLDANYFQHKPYLDSFNAKNGTNLVSVGTIHYEPFGIYPGKSNDLAAIADGATIAVPNDTTNEARALQLLAAQGLIEIDPEAGLNATPNDITSNPKNLEFTELDAAMIPNTIEEFDLNVINSNYALQAGLNPAEDALASEDAASDAAQTYANIIAVKAGHENDPAIVALVDALHSEEIQEFINTTYAGSVLPID